MAWKHGRVKKLDYAADRFIRENCQRMSLGAMARATGYSKATVLRRVKCINYDASMDYLKDCPQLPDWCLEQMEERYKGRIEYARIEQHIRRVCLELRRRKHASARNSRDVSANGAVREG